MKLFFKNKIIIISFLFVLSEFFLLFQLLNTLKEIRQYTYETTATIDFIGLPYGTIFVSCYDENNILHEDVIIKNKSIRGNLSHVESFYGTEIQIRLNTDKNYAIWLSVYYRLWFISIAVPLVYLILVMFFYFKLRRKRNINSDLSQEHFS